MPIVRNLVVLFSFFLLCLPAEADVDHLRLSPASPDSNDQILLLVDYSFPDIPTDVEVTVNGNLIEVNVENGTLLIFTPEVIVERFVIGRLPPGSYEMRVEFTSELLDQTIFFTVTAAPIPMLGPTGILPFCALLAVAGAVGLRRRSNVLPTRVL